MKFGVVNKSTAVNRFVPHTLQRNITHLAVITRKTNIKLGILKGGELEKSRFFYTVTQCSFFFHNVRGSVSLVATRQQLLLRLF